MWGETGTIANPKTVPAFEFFQAMRMILFSAAAIIMASCTTPDMNGTVTGVSADAPLTPAAFRKRAPQTGHWGSGVGYGSRY
jgi:hypothetical protein